MVDQRAKYMTRQAEQGAGARRVRPALLVASMLGLYSIGAFFILCAAYGFVRGLWQLLIFLGGILFYGAVAVQLDSFDEQLGRAVFSLIGPILFGAIGGLCFAAARRVRARLTVAKYADDSRAPVIYLRSFHVDKRLARRPLAIGRVVSFHTEEEQLVEALRELGPVVAIGRPGERLPRLGAQRIYVEDANWQQQILFWFTRAALVVIHIPPKPTEGLAWEIEESLRVVSLDRFVFLVPRDVNAFSWLNQKLQDHGLTGDLLNRPRRAPYRSRIAGIVHFVNGKPEFRALVKPPFFNRPFSSPLVPVYRVALAPVTTRITGSWRPLSRAFGDASIAAVWITFCALVLAVAFYLRRTQPLEREIMVVGQRLMKELPVEAREFAQNRDATALSAWMQSRFQSGLRYTSDDVALAMANVMRQLLAIASPAECEALAEGAIGGPALHRIFNELGKQNSATLATWHTCVEKAILESLKSQHTETFPVSEADAAAAFTALYNGLSEEAKAQYSRITENYEQSSAEDHCWFARTMFQGVERLQEPSRSKLARVGLGQDIEK
jgi:hypothetical protein